mgnify:CR=1 FL=1
MAVHIMRYIYCCVNYTFDYYYASYNSWTYDMCAYYIHNYITLTYILSTYYFYKYNLFFYNLNNITNTSIKNINPAFLRDLYL